LKAKELLVIQAIAVHNIRFMNKLMQEIRKNIANETLDKIKAEWCF
jgi:tRNA-guanine family transglycosylase